MDGPLFTGPTMIRGGLLMIGLLTALLLGGCESSAPTDVPTAAPTATLSGEEEAALEKVARSVIAGASPLPCSVCHTIGRVAFGKVGPDLSDIGARANAADIRESIVAPQAVIAENCPGGPCPSGPDDESRMPLSYADTLTEEEIDAIVWYLMGRTGE
jgi:mono/diheme cytochrome c family protein